MSFWSELLGPTLLRGKEEVSTDAYGMNIQNEKSCVALYFSAHWCPPCRSFTPQLRDWYLKNDCAAKGLDVVFCSSDREAVSMQEYYDKEMGGAASAPPLNATSFLAIPFHAKDAKKDYRSELATKFGISGIPTLIFLTVKGDVYDKDGRGLVLSKDREAKFLTDPSTKPPGSNFVYRGPPAPSPTPNPSPSPCPAGPGSPGPTPGGGTGSGSGEVLEQKSSEVKSVLPPHLDPVTGRPKKRGGCCIS
eukprot:g9770.t1